jgi:hypothetical protein
MELSVPFAGFDFGPTVEARTPVTRKLESEARFAFVPSLL